MRLTGEVNYQNSISLHEQGRFTTAEACKEESLKSLSLHEQGQVTTAEACEEENLKSISLPVQGRVTTAEACEEESSGSRREIEASQFK